MTLAGNDTTQIINKDHFVKEEEMDNDTEKLKNKTIILEDFKFLIKGFAM